MTTEDCNTMEEQRLNKPDPTVEAVCEDLRRRSEFGQRKYGHTLASSPDDMLQHLYEELLDGAGYAKELMRRLKDKEQENARLRKDLETFRKCLQRIGTGEHSDGAPELAIEALMNAATEPKEEK